MQLDTTNQDLGVDGRPSEPWTEPDVPNYIPLHAFYNEADAVVHITNAAFVKTEGNTANVRYDVEREVFMINSQGLREKTVCCDEPADVVHGLGVMAGGEVEITRATMVCGVLDLLRIQSKFILNCKGVDEESTS